MVVTAFEREIETSAAPAPVRAAFERLAETRPETFARLRGDDELRAASMVVVAASRSLTRLIESDGNAIDVLAQLDRREPVTGGSADDLVAWKRREYLRIAARDLLGRDTLNETGAALAAMAADVLAASLVIPGTPNLAVIGMGKLGGRELNYASDVDVMFVGDDSDLRPVRAAVDTARRCFRVDLNLRPEGRDGPLVRSLDSYKAYWDRWAHAWEAQALLKARPVAGDEALGVQWAEAAAHWLWSRRFDADDIRAVRVMKERAEAEVARKGLTDREVKRGRGGIRDVEFAVQLLQLVHGGPDPELRSSNTLAALTELADAGYVAGADADRLAIAYEFLRTVEHRLQLVDEQQIHAVPDDAAAREHLARVLGYRGTASSSAVEQFEADLRDHQSAVRAIHERLWFRPLLEAFAVVPAADPAGLSPEAAATRLRAFGFADAARTQQAVAELTRGLTRSSRLMQQLLPLLFDWLSASPDPDTGLLALRNLASGPNRSMQLAVAFRDSPEVARRLCCLVGTSRKIGTLLEHNPDLVAALSTPADLAPRTRADLVEDARRAAGAWRPGSDDRRKALHRFTDREGLRVMAHDVLDDAAVATIGGALTDLAESTLEAALDSLAPRIPFAVVAMGRFGGGELSYASDLDVLFAYDGSTAADFAEAERVAEEMLRFIGGSAPHIYDIDPDLRPEGKQGPLARSLDGFHTYFERWAQPWERLAMLRARPCAGDRDLGARFLTVVDEFVGAGLPDDDRKEIRRIKARVERERIPPGEDPQFHLKLGRGSLSDVEFTVQLLELEHRLREPSTSRALDTLEASGAMSSDDTAVLAEAYRFCERARNRWFLVNSGPGDSLPQQPEKLARLARSLDTTAAELRDDYRRVTRRARRVVERLFYGSQG